MRHLQKIIFPRSFYVNHDMRYWMIYRYVSNETIAVNDECVMYFYIANYD